MHPSTSRSGWNIKIIIFIIFMKCDEIGRWFIDDVKERWSVMLFDVSCPVEDTLDRMDVDLVRR